MDGKQRGLRAQGMGILQGGLAAGGCFATRAAKLGFCIIHPAGGETVLQNWIAQGAVRTRKQEVSAHRGHE